MKRIMILLVGLTSMSCLYAMEQANHKKYDECYDSCIADIEEKSLFKFVSKSNKKKCKEKCWRVIGISAVK